MEITKIAVVSVSAPALHHLVIFFRKFKETYTEYKLDARMFYVASAETKLAEIYKDMMQAIQMADIAIVDIMGASEALQDAVREALIECGGTRIIIGNSCRELIRLGSFSMDVIQKMKKNNSLPELEEVSEKNAKKSNAQKTMHVMRRMALMIGTAVPLGMMKDMRNFFQIMDYWQQAEKDSIDSLMYFLLRKYCKMKNLPKERPCRMKYGIYLKNPETSVCMERLDIWWKRTGFNRGKPLIAIMFYGHSYPNDFLPVVREVYQKLKEFANVLPIAFSQNEDKDLKRLSSYLGGNLRSVDAIVNLMPFRLGAGPMGGDADAGIELLDRIKAVYFKPFCLTKVEWSEWEYESSVNPGEHLINMTLPELDGGIHTYPIGIVRRTEYLETEQLELTNIEPISERVDMLIRRVHKFITLKSKCNQDKKVAVICYNYPSGEGNLFGGSFLDTFESVAFLLSTLQQNRYYTKNLSANELREIFCKTIVNEPNWIELKETEHRCIFNGAEYPIHGICLGNIFLGLQPCAVYEDDDLEVGCHNKNLIPPEEYQAFYYWITEEFHADAILHIGTHGTLEFFSGKDNGMMGDCWPDKLIGDVPHFYYYYLGNLSEAMVAKRRSHATLISYRSSEFVFSGLYGKYRELKELIVKYRKNSQFTSESSDDILEKILWLAKNLHLAVDSTRNYMQYRTKNSIQGNVQDGMQAENFILDKIEEILDDYEMSPIPNGLHIMDSQEAEGVLTALRGDYLPVSLSGDAFKNPDICLAGRNLVQFDPRLIPTKTAFERGCEVARQTVQCYYKEQGRYPESIAVILWGLETSRTQGETLGQIMYYLGIRMKHYAGSFDTKFEIVPIQELKRPRIDVTIHICGFFRNMYPNLLDNFSEIFYKLEALHETDEQSYFAKHTRENYQELLKMDYEEAKELARSRIFGLKIGKYGTTLTERIRRGIWTDESELALDFTENLSYIYLDTKRSIKVGELLELNYQRIEVISQIRNNVEYELIDLDHYYEFYGGLAKAVEQVRGKKVKMYVTDTTGERIHTGNIKDMIEKGIRTRLLNPRWIRGMLRHNYHGLQQIARCFDNIMGFAATTNQIESYIFLEMERCYVEDKQVKKRMKENNKYAYLSILNRLAEACSRGYWDATGAQMKTLQEVYLEIKKEIERDKL